MPGQEGVVTQDVHSFEGRAMTMLLSFANR